MSNNKNSKSQILFTDNPLESANKDVPSQPIENQRAKITKSYKVLWKDVDYRGCLLDDGQSIKVGCWKGGFSETYYCIPKKKEKIKEKYISAKPMPDKQKTEFNKLKNAEDDHPYLKAKGISIKGIKGLKVKEGYLLIPINDKHGKIITAERIWPKPSKYGKFKKDRNPSIEGTLPPGYNFKIPGNGNIFVCEGFATSVSVHRITGGTVYCSFGSNNLENVAKHAISELYNSKKGGYVVICQDNDGDNTKKISIKDKRLKIITPLYRGDFNDLQNDLSSKNQLLRIYDVQSTGFNLVSALKEKALSYKMKYEIDKKIDKHEFFDKYSWLPKTDVMLLNGGTECGKTNFCLRRVEVLLAQGFSVNIWEHSELNRPKRLNAWIKNNKIPTKNLFISPSREEIINRMLPGSITYIDSTDSFLKMKNTIDRREVVNALTMLTDIAQYGELSIIAVHYQTKSSKRELKAQLRGGGSMAWGNVIRYMSNIEVSPKDNDQKMQSWIDFTKGYKPNVKGKPKYWLDDKGDFGDLIDTATAEKMIRDDVESRLNSRQLMINLLDEYFKDNPDKNKIGTNLFLDLCKEELGIKKSTFYNSIKKLPKKYKIDAEGYGKEKISYVKLQNPADNEPVPF